MSDSKKDKVVVDIRSGAPSARMKQFADDDKRPSCRHARIVIWHKEPIIECDDCGAVVDPYYWIRERVSDWSRLHEAESYRLSAAREELAELKESLRILRREYRDEAEKRTAESRLMILPPRRRV